MQLLVKPKRRKKIALYFILAVLCIIAFLLLFVNRFLEPVLKDRLHTLIIQGSDSLYTYQLGRLDADFFGGDVEVENLQIRIDSNRYKMLSDLHALPSLTMQVNLVKGYIKGVGIIPLLFGKRIEITEIGSKDADIALLRHIRQDDAPKNTLPLWKAIEPAINSISIDRINLDGIKMLYRNADTSESVKLQFDRCVARFDNIRIDSIASADTTRIGFTKSISMQFDDLKFRTPDSMYKMRAGLISYSSSARTLELRGFKMQPTLEEKEDFYKVIGKARGMNVIEFERARLTNFQLDRFLHNNIIIADTVAIDKPTITIYVDKTYPALFQSKIGKYPHQLLLKAASTIIVKSLIASSLNVIYTEKARQTGKEGKFTMDNLNIAATNVTNDSNVIKRNNKCVATVQGKILGSSPIAARFNFYLDSTEGQFDADGTIKNVTATQLNALAEPMANTRLQSFDMHRLTFAIRGDNFSTTGNVQMLYNNLFVVLRKQDEETGAMSTKKFLTKVINRYSLHSNNPGSDGRERTGNNIKRARLSTQPFFGLVWKTIFTGVQNIMMQSGRIE